MNHLEKIYLVMSIFLMITMLITLAVLLSLKTEKRKALLVPVSVAILTILVYTTFSFARNYKVAMIFNALYFSCTSWLCLAMLYFSVCYCDIQLKTRTIWLIPCTFCAINTVSLVMNTWKGHAFSLTPAMFEGKQFYWICKYTWFQYIHYGWCYLLIAISVAIFIYKTIKAPYFYKRNYVVILVAYLFVIFANIICYSMNFIIDYSILLYPVLTIFVCYHTIHIVPRYTLSNALKNVNESIDDGIVYFNLEESVIYKNTKAKNLIANENGFDEQYAVKLFHKAKKKRDDDYSRPVEFFMQNNEECQYEIEAHDIYDEDRVIGSYLKLTDKTNEIQKYLTQKFLSTHDELTGLYTREHFFTLCDEKLRQNPNETYVMISSNILQFKLLNELFGEEVGNQVLLAIATTAKTLIIHDSIIGRINDDKYCCLAAEKYFDDVVLSEIIFAAQEVLKDSMYKVNLRLGICYARGTAESAQYLYDKTQLVIKKTSGDYRKFFAWYDSNLMDGLLRERQITSEFEDALKNGNISMYLQPFVDGDKKISGAEALARWKHRTYGLMLPETFIPVLERSGLIYKLDTFIWTQAAKTLEKWEKKNILDMQVSVNVSSKDIFYIDIPSEFARLKKEFNFNPKNLKLEFTEDAITNDKKIAADIFEKLRALGYEIGIDDFGNGHSSLNMLKDINVDVLKLDMVLIKRDENPDRAKIILEFISKMSHALGIRLISEGVESSEQLEMLKKLGYTYFQGFYFSKPMSIGDFERNYFIQNES